MGTSTTPTSRAIMTRPLMPDPSPLAGVYSPEVIALWGDKDEDSTATWMDEKIKDFNDGGKMKEKYETIDALNELMVGKVYGPGGTMDKTLKIRGNPKVF